MSRMSVWALGVSGLAALAASVPVPPSQAATLAEAKQRGYLVVAVADASSAFATVQDGKQTGFDADLRAALRRAAPFEIREVPMDADGLAQALAAGKADLVASSQEITPDAQKLVDFSLPLAETTLSVLTRAKDAKLATIADLGGRRFGVRSDSAAFLAQTELEHKLEKAGAVLGEPVEYDDMAAAAKDLAAGKIDYILGDLADLAAIAQTEPAFVVGQPVSQRTYAAWEIAKGNDELAGFLKDFLAKERQTGELAQLQQKWFGRGFSDMPDTVVAQNWWAARDDRPKVLPIPSLKPPD